MMVKCIDCFHFGACKGVKAANGIVDTHSDTEPIMCDFFKDQSRFVELKHAEWEEHEDMYGDPFYCCSNCRENYFLEEWTPIENRYFYCPNCGAKMDEQELKERERK